LCSRNNGEKSTKSSTPYHLVHEPWRHKRVRRKVVNGVKDPLARYTQVFACQKLAIRCKGLALNLRAVDEVTAFFDEVD
jgi:hypothetical protein